jgi:predicted O-methyltransferase YrrM
VHSFGPRTGDDDLAALRALVGRFRRPRVIEIGSWLGRTALAMRRMGAEQVHCIDTWLGTQDPADETFALGQEHGHTGVLRAFCDNVGEDLGVGIFPYVGTSAFWAERWPWEADLIFIDAEHSYDAALADIRAWAPRVRPGGVLCGHDYQAAWPGVIRAVEETGAFTIAGGSVWFRVL